MSEQKKSKVILRGVTKDNLFSVVQECMELCNWQTWVPRGGFVVVKPNLCTAVPNIIRAANTDLAVTEAVCRVLLRRANRVVVCEADHMRQKTPEVYEATGYTELAKLGVELVNLSDLPMTRVDCPPAGQIELPRLLFEADAFITLPKLKTHALTYFTASLKNQWGCVPHYHDRIRHHRLINEMLSSIHQLLQPKMSLVDGIVCMEGRGPVAGPARELNVILASEDSIAMDATAMRLVGLQPKRSKHVMIAARRGLGHVKEEEILVDGDWSRHATKFQPAPKDWANTMCFKLTKYPWFTKNVLGNDSIYYPISHCVKFVRRIGLLGG
jgi:uncharacterized protein (DUF362 family)